MTAISCPVCQQPIDEALMESGDMLCCPSCSHRLKFRAGELVNLGVDASDGTPLSTHLIDNDPGPLPSPSAPDSTPDTPDTPDTPGTPEDSLAAEYFIPPASAGSHISSGVALARRNAKLSTRRHQQSAVLWLLTATIFVATAVGFLLVVGPDRLTNIYRPQQLAQDNPELNDPRTATHAVSPSAQLAVAQIERSGARSGRRVLIDPNAQSKAKRASIFSAPILPEHYPPVQAQPLYASPWREPSEPFAPYDGLTQISLQNESLTDAGLGRSRFLADLVYDGQEAIESLTLYLALIDPQDHVIATMAQPMGLIDYTRPQRVNVTIPPSYAGRTSRVIWSADIGRKISGGVPIGQITVRTTGSGDNTALMIHAVNPVNLPLAKASFMLTAYNDVGHPVMHWRVDWTQRVEPSQGFYFKAITPVQPVWGAKHWLAIGIAAPAPPSADR